MLFGNYDCKLCVDVVGMAREEAYPGNASVNRTKDERLRTGRAHDVYNAYVFGTCLDVVNSATVKAVGNRCVLANRKRDFAPIVGAVDLGSDRGGELDRGDTWRRKDEALAYVGFVLDKSSLIGFSLLGVGGLYPPLHRDVILGILGAQTCQCVRQRAVEPMRHRQCELHDVVGLFVIEDSVVANGLGSGYEVVDEYGFPAVSLATRALLAPAVILSICPLRKVADWNASRTSDFMI